MEKRELNKEEMEKAAGGNHHDFLQFKSTGKDSCDVSPDGKHDYVFTGVEKEEPLFYFWSKHMKQYKCSHCGKMRWYAAD